MSEKDMQMLRKGREIAGLLNSSGLVMKECTVINKGKRINYARGDLLLEAIEKNVKKISTIYDDGENRETYSAISIAQRLLRENMIVKLERVNEEKKYKWPRKLALTSVIY